MARALSVALVLMAATAQTTASQSAPTLDPSEAQIPAASTARFPDVSERESGSAELVSPEDSSIYRYGSGLEDDAPVGASDPLQQSGLEDSLLHQAALARVAVLQYGSGLENDATVGVPNILLQSGLEESVLCQTAPVRAAVLHYGSGLEDGAPVRAPDILLESGLDDDAPVLNSPPQPGF
jgi:hypothetical protein